MQLIATGKWSKSQKEWKMIVALRRPQIDGNAPRTPGNRPAQPRKKSDR